MGRRRRCVLAPVSRRGGAHARYGPGKRFLMSVCLSVWVYWLTSYCWRHDRRLTHFALKSQFWAMHPLLWTHSSICRRRTYFVRWIVSWPRHQVSKELTGRSQMFSQKFIMLVLLLGLCSNIRLHHSHCRQTSVDTTTTLITRLQADKKAKNILLNKIKVLIFQNNWIKTLIIIHTAFKR